MLYSDGWYNAFVMVVNKFWIMVSESFGFTGPYVCWAVFWNYMEHFLVWGTSPLFLSNKGGNRWTIEQLVKLVDFMEYSIYF